MILTLNRQPTWSKTTLGILFVDGERECYTLEDQVRPKGEKIYGETAIPAGRYRVIVAPSPSFGRSMPRLVGVPNFEGVLVHWGNSAEDTLGCIITGSAVSDARHVVASRAAFDTLFPKIEAACACGEVWIEVKDAISVA